MRVVFVTHNELGLTGLDELVDLRADVRAWEEIIERTEVQLEGTDRVSAGRLVTDYGREVSGVFESNKNWKK